MRGQPTLLLEDVSIERGGKPLIANLSLELSGPKLLWVMGANGVGKTSLLRTCAGLSRPVTGEVKWLIDGSTVTAPECIGFLPAESYAKPGLKAKEDAAFWAAQMDATDMSQHGETLTQNLSTGQAKRLSFAKLLGSEKPIWILDEPLAGLDEDGRNLVAAQLQSHVSGGGLALVASHAPIPVKDIPTQRIILG